tara:strand:+ start:841 stop:1092 length:252 start_codon:yes stop_codon:yes gene_type:complete
LLSHNTLANYYELIFALVQHHKYSITEIENLIPYERDVYVAMLQAFLKDEKERAEQRKQGARVTPRKNFTSGATRPYGGKYRR